MKKKCIVCGKNKNIEQYHFHLKEKNKYRNKCKDCHNRRQRELRLERIRKINPEHAKKIEKIRQEKLDRGICPKDHAWCFSCKKYKHKINFSKTNLKNYSWCRTCSTTNDILRSIDVKLKAINYLGGKCKICKTDNIHYSSFQFHHKNPNKKNELECFKEKKLENH